MARQLSRPELPNYGSTSYDSEIAFSQENRELRILCDNISTNVYTINSSIRNLQGAYKVIGSDRDTQGLRDQIHVWQLSGNQVVKATTGDVAKVTALARSANKVQKLQVDKITSHFKDAVHEYSKIQLTVADKLRSTLPKQKVNFENEESGVGSAEEDEVRQQLLLQQELQLESELLIEREQRVREIENDILDVNQLMRELGALVHEQSAVVDSIESNIETTMGNVESGASELRSAARHQNKARKKKLILLIILVVILAVLIGIIIWSSG